DGRCLFCCDRGLGLDRSLRGLGGLCRRRRLLDVLVLLVVLRHSYLSSDAARSLRRVRIRAISRLARRRRALFSSAPVAAWKRRLKSSCRVSWSLRWSSSSL